MNCDTMFGSKQTNGTNRTLNPKLGIRYLIFAIGFLNVQPTLCTLLPVFTFLPPPIPSPRLLRFHHRAVVGPTTLAWQCNCRTAIVVIIRPIHLNSGAQVGSWYALGCLVSVTTLSQRFAQLCRRDKLHAVTLWRESDKIVQ
jgi:hypothetical protein